jgi:hypothetical protein
MEHVQPRRELGEAKGLEEMVVRASFEALDPILGRRHGRQDERRRPALLGAKLPENRQSVEIRQPPVDYQHVELFGNRHGHVRAAAFRCRDGIFHGRKPARDHAAQHGIVLDYQYPYFYLGPNASRPGWGAHRALTRQAPLAIRT